MIEGVPPDCKGNGVEEASPRRPEDGRNPSGRALTAKDSTGHNSRGRRVWGVSSVFNCAIIVVLSR